MTPISFDDFQKVDMRVGRVIKVEDFPEAKKPAYKLTIDFGPEIGIKKSSGQFTKLYKKEELLGRLVVCVINFPPKQIANFFSEALTLGFATEKGIVLLEPEQEVPLGSRVC